MRLLGHHGAPDERGQQHSQLEGATGLLTHLPSSFFGQDLRQAWELKKKRTVLAGKGWYINPWRMVHWSCFRKPSCAFENWRDFSKNLWQESRMNWNKGRSNRSQTKLKEKLLVKVTIPILFLSQKLCRRPICSSIHMISRNGAIIHIDAPSGTGQGHLLHSQLLTRGQHIPGAWEWDHPHRFQAFWPHVLMVYLPQLFGYVI